MKTLSYKYIKGKKVKIPISICSAIGMNKEKFQIMRNRKSIKGSIYGHVANDITWPGNQIITNLFLKKNIIFMNDYWVCYLSNVSYIILSIVLLCVYFLHFVINYRNVNV